MSEAYRIGCQKGHTIYYLRGSEGEDESAVEAVLAQHPTCMYCHAQTFVENATVDEFERWSTRDDGRYAGTGAPQ